MRRLLYIALAIGLFAIGLFAQSPKPATGTVRGEVFTIDAKGAHAAVPATRVALDGPVRLEAVSDPEGRFAIDAVPAGSYTITTQAPGMTTRQSVTVNAGAISDVSLEMKVQNVVEFTTVSASAGTVDSKQPSGIGTISESDVKNLPNRDERFSTLLPLIPGVVRGPNGLINMKGAHTSQNGSLLNSADVTDPATGTSDLSIPIDVVSSVEVFSTPYDPEYGKFTGAVSNVQTRPGSFDRFRFSIQNLLPRLRRVDGSIMGIAAATPRVTLSSPILKDRIAFTQSLEYRYERDFVTSLPPLQAWTRSENLNSYTQIDANINSKQTATASFAIFPQKLDYDGLNTFTPQESTPNLHQRGYQGYLQHRFITNSADLLTSQVSFTQFNADLLPNSDAPYKLLVETTEGGFFNRQDRNTTRTEWTELYRSHPYHYFGSHELEAGTSFVHSSYDGHQQSHPVEIIGVANSPLERVQFGPASTFSINQKEAAGFVGDKWIASRRLTFDLGLRCDWDSVTGSVNAAPRAGFVLALTRDGKTTLKAGAGYFYDRLPLNIPSFPYLPDRAVSELNSAGEVVSSTEYLNTISNGLENPRSEVWNLELNREITSDLLVRVGYLQRNTVHGYFVNPIGSGLFGRLSLSDSGSDIYKEFQVTGVYRIHHSTLNASYVHSRTYGDLNDFNQFFGNDPQPVIHPNQRGRLGFDAPNRVLAWGEIAAPLKLTVSPVFEVHTGFPYSRVNQDREFVGPRNESHFPRFVSADLQVWRRVPLHIKEAHARIGGGAFDIFNHPNYRDVQNDIDSSRFGEFFNGPGRIFHGKFILEF